MTIRPLPMLALAMLAACSTRPPAPVPPSQPEASDRAAKRPAAPRPAYVLKRGGAFYKDDGPGDNPPDDPDAIPDAVPRAEPLHRFANRPYSVLGRDYVPMTSVTPFRQRGIASWYGRRFHGQKTSSGEPYDMYAMTAAHPTLPIPSYARVTNPANGRSVVVRINDRGPFHAGRIIDLSWTAAWKLGYLDDGSSMVEVESIVPGQETPMTAAATPGDDPIARIALADTTPSPVPEIREARGIYLQLGAFGSADNAEVLRGRLARELGSLGEKLVVRSSGGLHRVQIGPWADHEEARRVVARLAELLDFRPVLVTR